MINHNRKRSSSIDRASIQSILSTAAETPAADPPSPHIGQSPNREQFSMGPPSRPNLGHSRAQSYAPRRPNRLSLSFPIATGLAPYAGDAGRPTPTTSSTQSFPPTPSDAPVVSPSDTAGFMVALASQERKVLELKEELQKAETELSRLKNQWRLRESYKKQAEIKHIEPLQSLQATTTEDGETKEMGAAKRQSVEIDKRKALLNNLNIPKESRRKFSGAHTRTLSLLSPERANYKQPFPFPPVQETTENGTPRPLGMPDTSQGITKINSNRNRHSYQSGVTHNAKLIAEDVKAGLWTFLEDIRQATIGDEATGNTPGASNKTGSDPIKSAVKKASRGSLRGSDKRRGQSPRGSPKPRARDASLEKRTLFDAVEVPSDKGKSRTKKPLTKQKISRPISLAAPAIDDLDDGWSNWDSPVPKSPRWSGSTTVSEDPPTPSNERSEENLINIHDEQADTTGTPSKLPRDEIQWPALEKLSPGNLKRTMSSLMQEWEKSLTPPPGVHKSPLSRTNSSTNDTKKEDPESAEERRKSTQEDLILMSR